MTVATTSRNHFKTYDASTWYRRIKGLMLKYPDEAWCIADIARALGAEKSTISARMNELSTMGDIEIAGTFPSHATGIKSRHYWLKIQPTLI